MFQKKLESTGRAYISHSSRSRISGLPPSPSRVRYEHVAASLFDLKPISADNYRLQVIEVNVE